MFAGYEGIEYLVDKTASNNSKLPASFFADPYPVLSKADFLYSKDFLILTEGSELDGPIPKLVIPEYLTTDFDIDEFSVSLMSIDMQNLASFSYNLNADAQVLQTISSCGYYAFVNYLTLYDIVARGFIRPYCLVYITKDYSKLINLYNHFSFHLTKVSRELKIRNAKLFHQDLIDCLADFEYTKNSYHMYMGGNRDFNKKEVNILKSINQENLDLDSIKGEINQLLLPLNILLKDEGLLTDTADPAERDAKPKLRTRIRVRDEKTLRSIEVLCDMPNISDYLSQIYEHLNKDESTNQQMGDLYIGGSLVLNFLSSKKLPILSNNFNILKEGGSHIGKGILQFIKQYSFSANLFFSILIGRPTFVIGSNKLSIRNIINTISLFLPGNLKLVEILETPFDLAHPLPINLIGILVSQNSGNNFLDDYITQESAIFNVDQKVFKGPKYKGVYLDKIVDSKLSFENDASYIAFINCALHELAMKAFAYYHGFFQHPDNCEDAQCKHDVCSQDFLKSISVQEDDSVIIQHLAQVILKEQFLATNTTNN